MQFLFPSVLWGLALLSIPVIVHLFYFRRFKKVYFTNVRFLREIKDESSTRNQLKNLLILLFRLLAALMLILAFAQPFIPAGDEQQKGPKHVSIYVDNSFSMNAQSEDVSLLDRAKQRAREIATAYDLTDKIQIITNDFEGRHRRFYNREDVMPLFDEIDLSPNYKSLDQILERQTQLFTDQKADHRIIYLISDFQTNMLADHYDSLGAEINLVPMASVQNNNVGIDSCWFDAPVNLVQQANSLHIRVHNYGTQAAENVRLSIIRQGQEQPVGTLTIAAQSAVVDTFTLVPTAGGWQNVEVKVSDYPVTFDDSYFLTYEVIEQIDALLLSHQRINPYLQAAMQGIPQFKLSIQFLQNVQYNQFGTFKLIVLDDLPALTSGLSSELYTFVQNGGELLIFPGKDIDLPSYNQFLNRLGANLAGKVTQDMEVGSINTDEFIFNDVYTRVRPNLRLPSTKMHYTLTPSSTSREEVLMRYRSGQPYLNKYASGSGYVYLSLAPLHEDVNDLPKQPEVFIPLLFKSALANNQSRQIAYFIGEGQQISADNKPNSNESNYVLRGADQEWIPRQNRSGTSISVSLDEQVEQAGIYDLVWGSSVEQTVALNYNRKESDVRIMNRDNLSGLFTPPAQVINDASLAEFTQIIKDKSTGTTLWKYCLILSLLFLALEALVIRFWNFKS